ncbi:MAG: Maf family protein [Bacillota bacterium]
MSDITLGSASPRRADLLRQIGLSFDILPSQVVEDILPGEDPASYCERAALMKARDVAGRSSSRLIIGADTVVVLDGEILGKPGSEAEARSMLERLSGRTHQVITGVCVLERTSGRHEVFSVTSSVAFRVIDPLEIDRYIGTGEPMDKAGAYAVQGIGAIFIRSMSGSYSNVVGLPLYETAQALDRFGVAVL